VDETTATALGWRRADADLGILPGLRHVGGEVTADTLLAGFRVGAFPLPTSTPDLLGWYSPDPRAVLVHDQLRCEADTLRRARRWRITIDECFDSVVQACADREERWIDDTFRAVYRELRERGHAHSVEVWEGAELVGGLFGVSIGGFWSGESMFHRRRNASKAAVYALVGILQHAGCRWHDVQYLTPFTAGFGATGIPRAAYLERLQAATQAPQMELVLPVALSGDGAE
jgi:leucyl/phenylalanyl-tRNA--protein transferase